MPPPLWGYPLGKDAEGQGLRGRQRFLLSRAVDQDPRKFQDIGDPTPIGLSVEFDGQAHGGRVACPEGPV
jgi:hypothetical protein